MTHKAKLFIIAILSCCAIFSMGFASWVITQSPIDVTGTITADDVMYSNEYLYMVGEPSGFTYTLKGFLDAEGKLVDDYYTGTMSVTYNVNFELCKKLYDDELEYVTVVITLGYSKAPEDYNIFADNSFVSATVNGAVSGGTTADGKFAISQEIEVPKALTEANKIKAINIEYTFTLGSKENYWNYVYNKFYDSESGQQSGLQFEFNASLTKGGN